MRIFFKTGDLDECVLDTNSLVTHFDANKSKYGQEQAEKGARLVEEKMIMTVAENGRWGAHSEDRLRTIQAYECIGYHTHTKSLLEGFVRAGGRLVMYGYKEIRGELVRWEEE